MPDTVTSTLYLLPHRHHSHPKRQITSLQMRKPRERTSNRPEVTMPWPTARTHHPVPCGAGASPRDNVLGHKHAPRRGVRKGQNVLFHHGADASTGFFRRLSERRLGVRDLHKVGLMKTQPKGSWAESLMAGSEATAEACVLQTCRLA